jgi:GNAT superfamily N-acetyltransferase
MEIVIRECGAADAAALALVAQATFLESYADVLPGSDILAHAEHEHGRAAYAGWLGRPGSQLWLAEIAEGRAPVGYAMLSPPDLPVPTDRFDLELKRIYLLHRFHGTGVGARLMAAAVGAARAAGARRLLLGVYGDTHKAMRFYGRQGFTRAGERKFQVGANLYDDLVLARPLEPDLRQADHDQGAQERVDEPGPKPKPCPPGAIGSPDGVADLPSRSAGAG